MSVFARILLRWIAGAFVTWGIITAQEAQMIAGEPDLIAAVATSMQFLTGLLIGAVTELWYALAKRLGWRT